MKKLKTILLILLLDIVICIAFIFIVFKFVITPERMQYYLESYVEKTIKKQMREAGVSNIDEIYDSQYRNSKEVNDFKNMNILDNITNIEQLKNIKILDHVDDINFLSSQVFSDVNMKMETLKYKIKEYLKDKNIRI